MDSADARSKHSAHPGAPKSIKSNKYQFSKHLCKTIQAKEIKCEKGQTAVFSKSTMYISLLGTQTAHPAKEVEMSDFSIDLG